MEIEIKGDRLTITKRLYFLNEDIFSICKKSKKATMRQLKINLNVGDLVLCCIRQHKNYFAIVKITDKQFIEDFRQMNYKEFKALGYKKGDYLKKPYNQLEDKRRFKYNFKLVKTNLDNYLKSNY